MTEDALSPTTLPLLYTFQDTLYGSGFIADVYIRGRATAIHDLDEDGNIEWLFSGVEPGGLARAGDTLNESFYAFKVSLKEILVELSHRSEDFDQFEVEVQKFVKQVNQPEARDWDEAREAVRRGDLDSPARMKRDTENNGQAFFLVKQVIEKTATADLNSHASEDSLATAA